MATNMNNVNKIYISGTKCPERPLVDAAHLTRLNGLYCANLTERLTPIPLAAISLVSESHSFINFIFFKSCDINTLLYLMSYDLFLGFGSYSSQCVIAGTSDQPYGWYSRRLWSQFECASTSSYYRDKSSSNLIERNTQELHHTSFTFLHGHYSPVGYQWILISICVHQALFHDWGSAAVRRILGWWCQW
jgi:hypothetical protein